MKHSFFSIALLAVAVFAFSSCAEIQPQEEEGTHTIKMSFNGSVAGYENSILRDSQTKAEALSWKDGDKIYMTFFNGETIVPGIANYTVADGWNLSYDGNLSTGSGIRCEARFFVNPTSANNFLVNINDATEIYEDLSATYNYDGTTLYVSASLSPKVGRIRFTGTSSDKIHLTGITHYSTFNPASNNFSATGEVVDREVQSSGSTDYVYGYFTHEDCRLGLVGSNFAFTRFCSNSIFGQGQSGFMKIPSETSHNNWRNGLLVLANGVEFKMIPVKGFSGGFFLLAETEMTEGLFVAITGITSLSSTIYPISNGTINYYYTSFQHVLQKLKDITYLPFVLPSADEWIYAAQGGNLSQGFSYSGSNVATDVAWYSSNSGGKSHEVKQKAPNELGLYDMSGNLAEYCSDGKIHGGDYESVETSIMTTSVKSASNNYGGYRLKLSF